MNDFAKPKTEVTLNKEEMSLIISTADELTLMSALEEKSCVEESAHVKIENQWELHPTFGKEFADHYTKHLAQRCFLALLPHAEHIAEYFAEQSLEYLRHSEDKLYEFFHHNLFDMLDKYFGSWILLLIGTWNEINVRME